MSNQEVVILRDRYGHKKGRYDKKRDCVYDEYGHLVGRGDMLTSLL